MIKHIRILGAAQSGKTYNMLRLYEAYKLDGRDPTFVLANEKMAKAFREKFNVSAMTIGALLLKQDKFDTLLVDGIDEFSAPKRTVIDKLHSYLKQANKFCTLITSEKT